MDKKTTFLLFIFILAASLFSACSPKEGTEGSSQNGAGTYADFAGKRIGVQTGEIYNIVARDLLDAGEVPEYTSMADLLESLRSGRIDAALTDSSYIQPLIDSGAYPDYEYIWVPKEVFANESAVVFHTGQLRDRWNAWFADITANGTMDEIRQRWLGVSLPIEEDVPKFESSGENGVLKVCNTGSFPPFNYFDANGEPTGMDYELASRFAQHMGMKIDLTTMDYEAIGPYVISGKADMSTCFLTVTEERRQSMIFGDPVVSTQGVLIVPKSVLTEGDGINTAAPSYTDFAGKKIGVATGTIWDQLTEEQVGGIPVYYTDMSAAIEDVRKGRLDGYMADLSEARVFTALPDKDDLQIITIPSEVFTAPMGAISNDQDIIDRFNVFLAEIKADGTLDEMQDRWLENIPDLDSPMPDIPLTGENGVLKYSASGSALPFSYVGSDNELKGYSVELAIRFAAHEGMDIEFTAVDFGGFIAYVAAGKTDIFIDAVSVTEERQKSVLFSDSIYDDQAAIIALGAGGETAAERDYTDFAGKNIANITGVLTYMTTEKIGGTPVYYSDSSAAVEDVRQGRAAGFMHALSTVRAIAAQPDNEVFEVFAVPKEFFSAQVGGISQDQAVIDRFNQFLTVIKADGTLGDMQDRWFSETLDLNAPIPDIPNTGENGIIKVATCSDSLPYAYVGTNGELNGFSVELALRFGAYLGKTVEFADVEFGGLINYIVGEKADISLANMAITEERKQSVLFTEPFFDEQHGILAPGAGSGAGDTLDYTDFTGLRFAVKNGTIYDSIATDIFEASETLLFEDYPSIYEAVLKGRADAGMRGYYAAYISLFEPEYSDLAIIAMPENLHNNPIGAISMDQGVVDQFNEFLSAVKADGTYDEMKTRWFDTFDPGNIPEMPEIPLTGENGTLTVAISSDYMPFSFLGADGVNLGFDIELAIRFAAYVNKDIEFADMAFSGLLPYVMSGKADIAISDITITEERKQSVLFTEPYFIDMSAIIYRRDFEASAENTGRGGFMEWLKTGIERNLITDNRWKMVVNGLGVTMIISFAAQICGTIFACFLCFVLTRKNRFIKWAGNLYCGLIHGTPIVVLLMITYYIIFGNTNISSVLVAIAAFTMVEGAIIAQNLKGAIETVDPVEIEAARSIGFSAFKAFRTVTLPQAVRRALPSYTNGFVELVKATAIVGYIAIQDLTRAGDIIRSRTYDAYFPLLFVALIYLTVTMVCIQLFKFIVKKINGGYVQ